MSRPDPTPHRDDLALARAIGRGDERAFRQFYEQAFPRLYRFSLRHCGDPAQAEETTQDALVIALEKIDSYRGESALLTWLFSIARHALLRLGSLDARLDRFEDEAALQLLLMGLESRTGQDEPDQQAAQNEIALRVHSVLDRLPPSYAECLEGKYVLGLSVREMAARQQRSEKAIESTLGRAREAFREAFLAGRGAEVTL